MNRIRSTITTLIIAMKFLFCLCYSEYTYASSYELRYKTTTNIKKPANVLSIINNRLSALKNTGIKFSVEKIDGATVKIILTDPTEKQIALIKNTMAFNKRLELRLTSPKSLYKLPGFSSRENAMKYFNNILPPKTILLPQPFSMNSFDIQDPKSIKAWHLLNLVDYLSPTIVTSGHFKDSKNIYFSVACKMDASSSSKFIKLSSKAAEQALLIAFTFDDKIICLVACNSPITSESIAISGHFDESDASNLAALLNCGPMLCKVKLISEQSIK